jgi:hypothetical protein
MVDTGAVHDIKFKRGLRKAAVTDVDKVKVDVQHFVLSPRLWKAFPGNGALNWHQVDFKKSQRKKVPPQRGVYCFIVTPSTKPTLPPIGFPTYVGETGDTSTQNLRMRFGQYLREAVSNGRGTVMYMLNKWNGHLRFYYAVVTDKRRSLRKIESHLNDAIAPPYSQQDFSATLRRKVRVLRST